MEAIVNEYIAAMGILVITPQNELKTLYCPFWVKDRADNLYRVTSITSGNDNHTYYRINGKYQIYSDFIIV